MVNSHNSNYFPGGVGLVSASGDLITVSPSSALVNNVLTLPSGGSSGGTTSTSTAPSPLTGVYNIDSFSGAQNNVSGNMNVFDDAAATNMWAQILSDARKCSNTQGGFLAKIVFGCHQYNWQNPINFIVPSGMPVEVHFLVDWSSSVHYTFGSAGFCFSPYTMDGRYDDWDSRKQINNRYQGVSAYAFKRTSTAGVNQAAYASLPNNETAGGGVSTFRFGQMDVYDANTGGYFLSYLDVAGIFFAQIKGPAGTSAPGPVAQFSNGVNNPGNQPSTSVVNVGTSAIRLGGFSIQVWIWDVLPNYVECVLRLVGYCEALMTMNFGGVNCDRGIWSDMNNTDFTSFYQGQYAPLFQVVLDQRTEIDCYKIGIDIVRCYIFQIYGGRIWTHASGDGSTVDGVFYGDVASNGGIYLRGCSVNKISGVLFDGPAVDSSFAGHSANSGLRAIQAITHNYSGLSGKTNGPSDGGNVRCALGEIDGNGFRGYGSNSKYPPIYYDTNTYKFTSSMNRWYYSPDTTDGYSTGYPVQDQSGGCQGYDFVGTGGTNTTLRTLR